MQLVLILIVVIMNVLLYAYSGMIALPRFVESHPYSCDVFKQNPIWVSSRWVTVKRIM